MEITNIWYFLSALTLLSALMVVFAKNPIHSVLYLVFTFFCISGHYVLLNAQFLMAVNIIVYAGAIMVLFLFVVMMLDLDLEHLRRDFKKFLPVAFLMGAVIVLELSIVIIRSFIGTNAPVQPMPEEMMANNTQALGMLIFVDYVYAFEVAGVILLVAIIAAVALTLRNRKDSKSQNIHEQVNVVAADRMRIVKMGSDMAAKQDTRGEKK